jgi:hypothetical protein
MKSKFFAGVVGSALLFAAVAAIGTTVPAFASDPIPGVDVKLGKNPGGMLVQTKTDAQGTFKLGQLTPGAYTIELQSFSWGVSNGKVDPNAKAAAHAILVIIKQSSSETPVVSSQQTVSPGQSIRIPFTIPDTKGPAMNHRYIGTVTLVK